MIHEHVVVNTDARFLIDPTTREITQQSGKTKLIQGDHNSERYEFELPRYIDGHDMSLCNDIHVNYINVSANRDGQSKGPYKVRDMQISADDAEKITFTWLVSRNSTKYAGTLNFNISFRCLSGAVVDYAWLTDIFKEIKVSAGIDNDCDEYVEEYIDILEQWKQDILVNLVKTVNGNEPDESGNITVDIPTKVSQLENDKGYLTEHQDLSEYAKTKDIPKEVPNVSAAHQQLVTDAEGNKKWEERVGYKDWDYVEESDIPVGIYSQGYGSFPFELFPVEGEEYTVTWDGTQYSCPATIITIDDENVTIIGSTTFFGGTVAPDIPVGVCCRSGKATVYSSQSGEHTIGISGYVMYPVKIPREYIDWNPVVGVIDSSWYNYRYLNEARGASIAEIRKAAREKNKDIVIRLDLDNWQGTMHYLGLIDVSEDGETYLPALVFSTIKTNNASINVADETINGTMGLEYWYTPLEPTEGPPANAFVNLQFGKINLMDTITSVNGIAPDEKGNVAIAIPTKVSQLENDKQYITIDDVPVEVPEVADPYQQLVTDADGNKKWEDRLAYTVTTEQEIIPLHTREGDTAWYLDDDMTVNPKAGDVFIVEINGEKYESVVKAETALGGFYLGNASLYKPSYEDTGESFLFSGLRVNISKTAYFSDSGTHVFRVYGLIEENIPIPTKYLPSGIKSGIGTNSLAFNAALSEDVTAPNSFAANSGKAKQTNAFGVNTGEASGYGSFASGDQTVAKGDYSFAQGFATVAAGRSQHVSGKNNIEDTENKYAHIVGNGSNVLERSNAHTLDWDGNAWFAGNIKVGGTGQDDEAAQEVALKGEIPTDEYINALIDAKLATFTNAEEVSY